MLKNFLYTAVISLVFVVAGCQKYNVELGHNYVWKLLSYGSGKSIVVNSKNQIVIGPGGIDLWAKYPWIYGSLSNNDGLFYWAINMKTQQVIAKMSLTQFGDFRHENGISDDLRLLATWGDVTVKEGSKNNPRMLKLQKAITSQ